MVEESGQVELFPRATVEDVRRAKSLLTEYRKTKNTVDALGKFDGALAPEFQAEYNRCRLKSSLIESAVNIIVDAEVRRIIEYRYIQGHSHKATIVKFGFMHPVTVGRKLNEGIASVAGTLKLLNK